MERAELERLIANDLTTRQIAAELTTSQTNVRYWLKRYSLFTRRGPHGSTRPGGPKRCAACQTTDPVEFSPRAARMCRSCKGNYTITRQRNTRSRAVAALGGRCTACGYNEADCALDIHHLDPETKDQAFSSMRGWSWARVQAEIVGCVLLCKNCHAIEHARQTRERFEKESRTFTY